MDINDEPIYDAVKSLVNKEVVAGLLSSSQWEDLPRDVRARAFFSATVDNVRYLAAMREKLLERIRLEKSDTRSTMDRAKFVKEMQELAEQLGLRPVDEKRGTLRDVGSERRLRLIWDTQIQMAAGYAQWKMAQDELFLATRPAWELIRVESRNKERDWTSRWMEAGGTMPEGRMVALINDPIWVAISRFGNPYPPFDYNSGMGIQVVRRREAVRLGLLSDGSAQSMAPEAVVPAADPGFSEDLTTGLATLGEEQAKVVEASLGGSMVKRETAAGSVWKWLGQATKSFRKYILRPFQR